ncbi:hypothetical protein [uncultured Rubinisphaera sp.]|uniref:hypothetical protein n=1 Tax=uncultured Rubinisphaera sp. TaxID=1678686 RepID=UPI0026D74E2A|tara:strand:+ start:3109 stop:4350 length:1242 start_codon:yes stop_codon:yes gene_type:complete
MFSLLATIRNKVFLGLIITGVALNASSTAQAGMSLKDACQVIADTVCSYLEQKDETSVMIGNYYGGSGPEIQRILKVLIEAKGFDTKDGMTLEGRCIAIAGDDLKIRVVSTLLSRNFEPITTIPVTQDVDLVIDDKSDTLKGTGTNVDVTKYLKDSRIEQEALKEGVNASQKREEYVNKEIAKSYQDQNSVDDYQLSTVVVDNASVSPESGSDFSVELLVKNEYGEFVEKKSYLHKGKPFVDYNFGDVIGIRVNNKSAHDVVVDVSIDGISVFEYSEIPGYKINKLFLVNKPNYQTGKGGSLLVKGWHKTDQEVYEFLVTDVENSEAVKLKRPRNNIGLVTVLFYPAWQVPEEKPGYLLTKKSSTQDGGMKKGDTAGDSKKPTALYFDRNTPLASIAVRYDVKVDHNDAQLPK